MRGQGKIEARAGGERLRGHVELIDVFLDAGARAEPSW